MRNQMAKIIWEVMLLVLVKMKTRVMKMEMMNRNKSNKRRRERRMSSRLNAKFLFLQDTETSIKMYSARSTTMVWFTMEDLLLTRVSKPPIHPYLQLEVYVNFQEDIKLLVKVNHSEWTDTMEERWDQDWQEVYLTSMMLKQTWKEWKKNFQASIFHKVKVVFFQEKSYTIT